MCDLHTGHKVNTLTDVLLDQPNNSLVLGLEGQCCLYFVDLLCKKGQGDLYSAFIVVPHTQRAQAWITVSPCLPLPHKRSPDVASAD